MLLDEYAGVSQVLPPSVTIRLRSLLACEFARAGQSTSHPEDRLPSGVNAFNRLSVTSYDAYEPDTSPASLRHHKATPLSVPHPEWQRTPRSAAGGQDLHTVRVSKIDRWAETRPKLRPFLGLEATYPI
jgi:hypothetical protein